MEEEETRNGQKKGGYGRTGEEKGGTFFAPFFL